MVVVVIETKEDEQAVERERVMVRKNVLHAQRYLFAETL